MFNFLDFFRKDRSAECSFPGGSIFHYKYNSFKVAEA
jgi:hypothetical protein